MTTRKPSFTPEQRRRTELRQPRLRAGEGLGRPVRSSSKVAGRISFSGTTRGGVDQTYTRHRDDVNGLNNLGVRGQILYCPVGQGGDHAVRPITRGSARTAMHQVIAGVAPTLRPANRQYAEIAADLGYTRAEFQRLRSRHRHRYAAALRTQDLGGASLNIDWKLGPGRLTSTTAWRYWDWDPSNDRDFIGLPVTTVSAATSKQRQWTQEVRYAGDVCTAH